MRWRPDRRRAFCPLVGLHIPAAGNENGLACNPSLGSRIWSSIEESTDFRGGLNNQLELCKCVPSNGCPLRKVTAPSSMDLAPSSWSRRSQRLLPNLHAIRLLLHHLMGPPAHRATCKLMRHGSKIANDFGGRTDDCDETRAIVRCTVELACSLT